MKRYIISLAYNGKNYHGWQRQPNGITIQEILEDCLSKLLGSPIVITGAGRTDAGVHASFFYAHFDSEYIFLNKNEKDRFVFKLNRFLPKDIVVYDIMIGIDSFHSRFSAISRTYKYYITLTKDPFANDFLFEMYGSLDVNNMNVACAVLMQYTDFSCFSKSNTQTKTNNCRIDNARWYFDDTKLIFEITANRFLRNMVRAIVGTLLEVGKGKLQPFDLHQIIKSEDRSNAGTSVPGKGLFLENIEYPKSLIQKII